MACVEGRQRHRFDGNPNCIYCGTVQGADYGEPDAVPASPVGEQESALGDSLDSLEQEAQAPATDTTQASTAQPAGTKWTRRIARKGAEAEAEKNLRRMYAGQIVKMVEEAKKLAAQQVFNYQGQAFVLEMQEQVELTEGLTQYLDLVGWKLEDPRICLLLLVVTELRITVRQFRQMKAELKAQPENATEKPADGKQGIAQRVMSLL